MNEKIKEEKSGNYSLKMKQSLHKYLSRSAFRCTPFGIFAGCAIAKITNKTDITLLSKINNSRKTRLDMNFLGLLVQEISKIQFIKEQLRFYPNDSICELGGVKRYIEYYFIKTNCVHKISSIESNEYLEKILKSASNGMEYRQLLNVIDDGETDRQDIVDFLDEIVNFQLLKNELELSVTGEDQLSKTINILEKLVGCEEILLKLNTIKNILKDIDSNPIGNTIEEYEKIETIIKQMGISYEKKYLFQTDMFKPVINAQISKATVENLMDGITFLNMMTPPQQNENIKKFIIDFQNRYGESEIPLLEVLDNELGIGYANIGSTDQNPLLNDILYKTQDSGSNLIWQNNSNTSIKKILLKKYIDCIKTDHKEIDISDIDIKGDGDVSWDDLPLTMYSICNVLDDERVFVKTTGGESAINLLGRFGHLSNEFESVCKEITQKEQELNPNVIFAEIVHLPESRLGNVLYRPILREYEIPYLSNVGTTEDSVIFLSYIIILITDNRIVLKSKRLNKEIIPKLSTAHNYNMSTLPVYRFLCDIQWQNIRIGLDQNLSPVFDAYDFQPRIVYKKCILSKRRWRILEIDFENIYTKTIKEKTDIIIKYCKERQIPKCVSFAYYDNELFIDFSKNTGIDLFIKLLIKYKTIILEEILFDVNNLVIKDVDNKGYTNEFIFTFYKNIE